MLKMPNSVFYRVMAKRGKNAGKGFFGGTGQGRYMARHVPTLMRFFQIAMKAAGASYTYKK